MKPLPSRLESFWMGVIAGAILAFAFAPPAKADGRDWATVTVASYHKERDRGYNEVNSGIGIERALPHPRWRYAVGFYENSYEHTSAYALLATEVFSLGNWKFGVAGGLVTGYESGRANIALAPIITWEGKRFGVNLFPVTPSVIGFQVKMRF